MSIILFGLPKGFRFASPLTRFGASIIDGLILGVVSVVLREAMLPNLKEMEPAERIQPTILYFLVSTLVSCLYFVFLESSQYQGTLGKLALGIIVTDEYGDRISPANALGRYFAKFLSSITFGIGYIMIMFRKDRRGLHDLVASTFCLKRDEKMIAYEAMQLQQQAKQAAAPEAGSSEEPIV